MDESTLSSLLTPMAVYVMLFLALVVSIARKPRELESAGLEVQRPLVIGITCQCAHFVEEFVTGFHLLFPPILGLQPMPAGAFVAFNLFWIAVWVLAAWGASRGVRAAFSPIWFLALVLCVNGVAHPLMAIWAGGYFPGLVTAPILGLVGVVLTRTLLQLTRNQP